MLLNSKKDPITDLSYNNIPSFKKILNITINGPLVVLSNICLVKNVEKYFFWHFPGRIHSYKKVKLLFFIDTILIVSLEMGTITNPEFLNMPLDWTNHLPPYKIPAYNWMFFGQWNIWLVHFSGNYKFENTKLYHRWVHRIIFG